MKNLNSGIGEARISSYRQNIRDFHARNQAKSIERYGDSLESPLLAAKLILAYISNIDYQDASKIQSGEGKTIVISVHSDALSHATRCALIAKELIKLKAEVILMIDVNKRYAKLICEEVGITADQCYHVNTFNNDKFLKYVQSGSMQPFFSEAAIIEEVGDYRTRLKEIQSRLTAEGAQAAQSEKRIDAIVVDHTFANIAAESLGLKLIYVWNTSYSSFDQRVLDLPESLPLTRQAFKLGIDRIVLKLSRNPWIYRLGYKLLIRPKLKSLAEPINAARRKFNAPLIDSVLDQNAGGNSLVLLSDPIASDAFVAGKNANGKGSDVFPVGTISYQPSTNILEQCASEPERNALKLQFNQAQHFLNPEISSPYYDSPLFLFVVGSTGTEELFRLAIEVFSETPFTSCRLFMVTGNQITIEELGALSDNIHIMAFYPLTPVLRNKNVAGTWTHGGSGSTFASIDYGIPVLCTPTHLDQEINSKMISQQGLGDGVFYRLHKQHKQVKEEIRTILLKMVHEINGI